MSGVPGANLSAPLSYPIDVRYEAVRTTWRHKYDGELEGGFITIRSLYDPLPQALAAMPCLCELQWAHLVTPTEPNFTCNYNPSDGQFVDFKAPDFLEDPTGMDLGYRDSDDDAVLEVGMATIEGREAKKWTARYPSLVAERSGVLDDNGHEFLLISIIFRPKDKDRGNAGGPTHNRRKI